MTSKDTEAGRRLNLAIKRAKPNLVGPSSPAEESDKKKTAKKAKKKEQPKQPTKWDRPNCDGSRSGTGAINFKVGKVRS